MNRDYPPERSSSVTPGSLPEVGVGVRVMHEGRQLTAYLDSQGNWRDEHNGDVLCGHVMILKIEHG
jgi:hypothetical protein